MSLIFISYKSEERDQIRLIAERLKSLGLDVWFDQQIRTGERWDSAIDEQLRGARVVIVCWTKASTQASWVIWEATYGQQNGILAPVFLEECTAPGPLSFVQGAKLTGWKGEADHAGWIELLTELERLLERTGLVEQEHQRAKVETLDASEADHWKRIGNSIHPGDFENFLSNYPSGQFSALAHARLEKITDITDTYGMFRASPKRVRNVRLFGLLAFVLSFAILLLAERAFITSPIHNFVFDTYQRLAPRSIDANFPAMIVEIDDASIAAIGSWPWPRSRMAELVQAISTHKPAAIGFDIVFSEVDRYGGEHLANIYSTATEETKQILRQLPDFDLQLSSVIGSRDAYVVLGRAGVNNARHGSPRPPGNFPVGASFEGETPNGLLSYPSALTNIETLDESAVGHGLLNWEPDADGVIRRVHMMSMVGGKLTPSYPLELVRVATLAAAERLAGHPTEIKYKLNTANGQLRSIELGHLTVPVQPDGRAILHFSPPVRGRAVSAHWLLSGAFDPGILEGKLVTISFTGVGAGDLTATPLISANDGGDIQAQVVESILSGAFLTRPGWAPWAELSLAIVVAVMAILIFPLLTPLNAVLMTLAGLLATVAVSTVGFAVMNVLIDPTIPILLITATTAATLTAILVESTRNK